MKKANATRPSVRPVMLIAALFVSSSLLAGCESRTPKARPGAREPTNGLARQMIGAPTAASKSGVASSAKARGSIRIEGIPHIEQKPDFCGEAVLTSALRHRGHQVDQDDVFAHTGVDPAAGRGAYTAELAKAARAFGFDVGRVWYTIEAKRAPNALKQQLTALRADLQAGIPSIVCMRYDKQPKTTEHFRLIVGYDQKKDGVIYHEPAKASGAYLRMKSKDLLSLWPLKYKRDKWTVIRLRLDPKNVTTQKVAAAKKAARPRGSYSKADFAQHVRKLRRKLPRGFSLVIEPPFVVIGDQSPALVRHRATHTVRWATMRLKKAYFKRDPLHIIDVWLFKDKESYRHYAWKLFGHRPSTPYGYYSSAKRVLVMNISTGAGTLVHEIVHPFVEANFPGCPSWFNEGLGSLYEQCGDRNGRIMGFLNWRLPGLQTAIRNGNVPSFKWLTSRTTNQFYYEDPGTNYSQSRYLVYYLQEIGRLRRYYRAFYKNRKHDPTGYTTLEQVLGVKDMKKFQRRWQAWVMRLKR
jgi:hypothetical protein